MRYLISHEITYTYDRPVVIQPHSLRLRPRCDLTQMLRSFQLDIDPVPQNQIGNIDLDGNSVINLWFAAKPTESLRVQVRSEVETLRTNPFAFLIDPWAMRLPIDYPMSLYRQLQPYLSSHSASGMEGLDPIAVQLGQEILHQTGGDVVLFLSELNQRIHQTCKHIIRETGDPLTPGLTWTQQVGSCRDLTVLFMEVCRSVGLAVRFVSGYHEGDPDWEHRHLHAWAEVYLPGAGWRGYDPTQALAVGDRYIAVAASAHPRYAAPLSGSIQGGGATSTLDYRIAIESLAP